MSAERAYSFELVDIEYHDSLGSFDTEKEAVETLAELADKARDRVRFLAVVSFDEDGEAISSQMADQLLSLA